MGAGIDFPHGISVWRDRKGTQASPYNPDRPVAGDWNPELTVPLSRGYLAPSSSARRAEATRQQIAEELSLFFADEVDVARGDRISVGGTAEGGGEAYYVNLRPRADENPFTGDLLAMEIFLDYTEG